MKSGAIAAAGGTTEGNLEQELGGAIRRSAAEIVQQVIDKAKEGSYLHAKFLFELAGLDLTQGGAEDGTDEESLAAYLLKELKESAREDTESQPEG